MLCFTTIYYHCCACPLYWLCYRQATGTTAVLWTTITIFTLPWANLLHQQPVVCVCRDPLAKPKAPQWIDPIGLTHTKGVSFACAFPLCRPGTPWFDLFGYTLTKTICRLQILLCFDSWVEWLAQAAIRTKGRHSYLPSVYEEPQARLGLRL